MASKPIFQLSELSSSLPFTICPSSVTVSFWNICSDTDFCCCCCSLIFARFAASLSAFVTIVCICYWFSIAFFFAFFALSAFLDFACMSPFCLHPSFDVTQDSPRYVAAAAISAQRGYGAYCLQYGRRRGATPCRGGILTHRLRH